MGPSVCNWATGIGPKSDWAQGAALSKSGQICVPNQCLARFVLPNRWFAPDSLPNHLLARFAHSLCGPMFAKSMLGPQPQCPNTSWPQAPFAQSLLRPPAFCPITCLAQNGLPNNCVAPVFLLPNRWFPPFLLPNHCFPLCCLIACCTVWPAAPLRNHS